MTEGLVAALAKVQAELPAVRKEKTARVLSKRTGKEYSYQYADLADIAAEIHPLLAQHGLVFIAAPTVYEEPARYVLVGSLEHVSGEKRTGMFPLPFNADAAAQDIGSAITYGRRYLLCSLTGVVADADDDGEAASRQPRPAQRQNRRSEPASETSGGITRPQSAKLHALFNANGLADRAERLAYTSGLIGRDIATSNELTRDEASRLIDHLERLSGEEASDGLERHAPASGTDPAVESVPAAGTASADAAAAAERGGTRSGRTATRTRASAS